MYIIDLRQFSHVPHKRKSEAQDQSVEAAKVQLKVCIRDENEPSAVICPLNESPEKKLHS